MLTKTGKRHSSSGSEETQLKDESDFDEPDEDVSNFFQTPARSIKVTR
jgi:hypothetical protein